jgi:D-alanyl-D-alanine carboxypeptidase
MHFAPNEAGGTSIMLQADDGTWHEFARSGEIYTGLDPALASRLRHILDRTIADNPAVPGAVLYVSVPGQGHWTDARGLAHREHGIPMVPHDQLHVASISKTFVATVILQLAEEGVLSLDDSVEQWMPGLVPGGEHVRLHHLLNHTSGLYNYLEGPFVSAFLADHHRFWTQQELVSYAASQPPYFAPGTPGRWHYSNTNYVLLGMVVEHATGTSMGQQVRWRILDPLGLRHTYFEPYEAPPGDIAHGYLGWQDVSDINMSIVWSAGGVVSTAEDLGIFAQALFEGRLLSPESMETMHGFVGVGGSWGARHLVYGMGLMQDVMSIGPDAYGQPRPEVLGMVRGHSGALTGYRTAMWYLPESGITVVAGVNQMYYDPNIIVTDAIDAILTHTGR